MLLTEECLLIICFYLYATGVSSLIVSFATRFVNYEVSCLFAELRHFGISFMRRQINLLRLPLFGELMALPSETCRTGSHTDSLSSREETVLHEQSILTADWFQVENRWPPLARTRRMESTTSVHRNEPVQQTGFCGGKYRRWHTI